VTIGAAYAPKVLSATNQNQKPEKSSAGGQSPRAEGTTAKFKSKYITVY